LQPQEAPRQHTELLRICFLFVTLALPAFPASAQSNTLGEAGSARQIYARKNTLGMVGAYSWDSSHILLGDAEQRMLVNLGVAYSRRLWLNHAINWQYDGELLPVALESDPLTRFVNQQTSPVAGTYAGTLDEPPVSCAPFTISYSYVLNNITYSGTETYTCSGRQWTIGEAMSPIGMQWNFLPTRRMQPFVDGHGGYMYTTQHIPVAGAGSFNFTFDIGAGVEIYRSKTRSIRAEYRYHHISNKDTATLNPGIDNGLLQVTYCFGFGRQ
jgi:opacity protein-like surface antigen